MPWCSITKLIIRVNFVSRCAVSQRPVSCSVFCHRWSINTASSQCCSKLQRNVTSLWLHRSQLSFTVIEDVSDVEGKKWECRTVKCKLQSFAGNRRIKPWAPCCMLNYELDLESSIHAPIQEYLFWPHAEKENKSRRKLWIFMEYLNIVQCVQCAAY